MPSISDKTEIGLPIKNLLGLIAGTAVAVWAYFGIIERLNNIETRATLSEADLEKNTEFRIKWPRGEMGALPADQQQDMLIEFMATQLEAMQKDMDAGRSIDEKTNITERFQKLANIIK